MKNGCSIPNTVNKKGQGPHGGGENHEEVLTGEGVVRIIFFGRVCEKSSRGASPYMIKKKNNGR